MIIASSPVEGDYTHKSRKISWRTWSQSTVSGKRLLLVEDNEAVARSMLLLLAQLKLQCDVVEFRR